MELLEESLGLVDHLHNLRGAFRPEDDEASIVDNALLEKAMKELTRDRQVAVRVMERLAHDVHFLREQAANLFNNEIVVWREPDGSFSLRMFIWAPDSDDFIHDHNAPGMLAGWWGRVTVENFTRLDSGGEDRAEIKLKDKRVLEPGDTALVRPFEQGIHRLSCVGDIALSVSVYGRKVGDRSYILRFDPQGGKVQKIYHRSRRRKEWAKRLLDKFRA